MQAVKKTFSVIASIILWLVVAVSAFVTVLVFTSQANSGIPDLFGMKPFIILTDSMAPTFKAGDLVISTDVQDESALQKDDIVTFWTIIEGKRTINTHRIVKIEKTGGVLSFVTRGDANSADDDLMVYPADIIGKYKTHIAGLGKVLGFLQSSVGFLTCIVFPLILFFLWQLYKFIMTIIELKSQKVFASATPADLPEEIKQAAVAEYLEKHSELSNKPESGEKK